MKELKQLAIIADELDARGLRKEADIVVDIMKRVAQATQPIPNQVVVPVQAQNANDDNTNAWKQAFADKYNKFKHLVSKVKDVNLPTDVNPLVAKGLYDEMIYMASNYLQNDPEVFEYMKWVAPTYKGLFE